MTLGVSDHLIFRCNSSISLFTQQYNMGTVRNQRGITVSFWFNGNLTLNNQVYTRSMDFIHQSVQESLFIIDFMMIMH